MHGNQIWTGTCTDRGKRTANCESKRPCILEHGGGGKNTTGFCPEISARYSTLSTSSRYRLHGLTMVVKGAATIFYLAGLWFSRRYTYEEQRNEPGSPETPTSGKGRAGSQGK